MPPRLFPTRHDLPADNRRDLVALLNAHSSAKRGGQIGRFGVGFKSLLKLGGRVDIVSRSIGLRFDPAACRARIRARLSLPPEAPVPRVTLSLAAITTARALMLAVTGDAKRKVIETAIKQGPASKYPIGRVLADAELPADIHWAP